MSGAGAFQLVALFVVLGADGSTARALHGGCVRLQAGRVGAR